MNHEAIYNTHSSVVTIRGDHAFDADDNPVTLDQVAVDTEIARLVIQVDADAITKQNRLDSVKTKLEALGLTTEEVQEAFGL